MLVVDRLERGGFKLLQLRTPGKSQGTASTWYLAGFANLVHVPHRDPAAPLYDCRNEASRPLAFCTVLVYLSAALLYKTSRGNLAAWDHHEVKGRGAIAAAIGKARVLYRTVHQ